MSRATVLAGFGGQGLLFAGHVLAEAALQDGHQVSWLPSYGPEMRGGTATCTVVIADAPIGAPVVDEIDVLVALNAPSLARFEKAVRPGGLLVLNGSQIDTAPSRRDVDVVRLSASDMARHVGEDRLVSVVGLGAALARRGLVSLPAAMAAIGIVAAKAGLDATRRNERALLAGFIAGTGG